MLLGAIKDKFKDIGNKVVDGTFMKIVTDTIEIVVSLIKPMKCLILN